MNRTSGLDNAARTAASNRATRLVQPRTFIFENQNASRSYLFLFARVLLAVILVMRYVRYRSAVIRGATRGKVIMFGDNSNNPRL